MTVHEADMCENAVRARISDGLRVVVGGWLCMLCLIIYYLLVCFCCQFHGQAFCTISVCRSMCHCLFSVFVQLLDDHVTIDEFAVKTFIFEPFRQHIIIPVPRSKKYILLRLA